jgi:type II secretory pathway pseudopilin PulG
MIRQYLKKYKRGEKKKYSAFTLVETVLILFIISVGLIGVLSLIIQNIQSQVINKNNIIAHQLAQEGLELIRKTRDTNWLNSSSWNQNLAPDSYYMDYLDEVPQILLNPSDAYLYKNIDGFYVHDSNEEETVFSRRLEIVTLDADSMSVSAVVTWNDRNHSFDFNLETWLYDWQ